MRKLAAHQGQVQGGEGYIKDGFLAVLARLRFQARARFPVAWKDESAENGVHILLKEVHHRAEVERNSKPHPAVPYRARKDRHVIGPDLAHKPSPSTYTIIVDIDESLIRPRSPTPPPEPQRHSDSALLNNHHHSHAPSSLRKPQSSKRDSGGTSLSFGDQPRNTTQFAARAQSMRGRGRQPLPVFRNRRDLLKEKIVGSLGSGSPRSLIHSGETRLSESSGRIGSGGESHGASQEGVSPNREGSRYGSLYGTARRSSQGSSSRGSYEDAKRGTSEGSLRNPYEYLPRGSTEAYDGSENEHSLRRANTTRSHGMSKRRVFEGTISNTQGSSTHRVSEGASHGSYGNFDRAYQGVQRVPNDYASQSDLKNAGEEVFEVGQGDSSSRDQDSDSDTSSVGRWCCRLIDLRGIEWYTETSS